MGSGLAGEGSDTLVGPQVKTSKDGRGNERIEFWKYHKMIGESRTGSRRREAGGRIEVQKE